MADLTALLTTVRTGVLSATCAQSLCLNPTNDQVYVGNRADAVVAVVDAVSDSIVARVPAGGDPVALCHNPAYNYVYVATTGSTVGVMTARRTCLLPR